MSVLAIIFLASFASHLLVFHVGGQDHALLPWIGLLGWVAATALAVATLA